MTANASASATYKSKWLYAKGACNIYNVRAGQSFIASHNTSGESPGTGQRPTPNLYSTSTTNTASLVTWTVNNTASGTVPLMAAR